MDKIKQFKSEYDKLAKKAAPHLGDNPDGFEFYIESCLLRIWAANGRYAEDYAKAIEAISGKSRTGEEILKAMIGGVDAKAAGTVPGFFAAMVDSDFENGTKDAMEFIDGLKSGRRRIYQRRFHRRRILRRLRGDQADDDLRYRKRR